jgi:hypothetical protein
VTASTGVLHAPPDSDVLDVAALRVDDALVERLAAGVVGPTSVLASARSTEVELVAMLAAWVAEIRPEAGTGGQTCTA